jgi:hypothetical protein
LTASLSRGAFLVAIRHSFRFVAAKRSSMSSSGAQHLSPAAVSPVVRGPRTELLFVVDFHCRIDEVLRIDSSPPRPVLSRALHCGTLFILAPCLRGIARSV